MGREAYNLSIKLRRENEKYIWDLGATSRSLNKTKKAAHSTCAGAWKKDKRSSGNLFQRLEAVSSEGTDTSLVTQQRKGASEY